jgi:hypothetical protein
MRGEGHAAHMGEMINAYKMLSGKAEGKKPLAKPRCRWDNNITMALKKQGGKVWNGFIWLRTGTSGRLL